MLQVNTILTSNKLEHLILLGLLSSAAFVAEGVTYLSYTADISEENRRTGKLFHGYVPLSGKKLYAVKASMYLLSFCQLLGKSMQVSVLVQIGNKKLAFAVLGCELGVYLLYKVFRSDFRYW